MRRLIVSSGLLFAVATGLAQAPPDARVAPPVIVRKTVQTTSGQTLEGRVLNEGMSDLQLRTDDQRIHLLRKAAGDRYRVVTSQRDWTTYHGDPGGNRYTTLTADRQEQRRAAGAALGVPDSERRERRNDADCDRRDHVYLERE